VAAAGYAASLMAISQLMKAKPQLMKNVNNGESNQWLLSMKVM